MINHIVFEGRLCNEPKTFQTQTGKQIAVLTLAHNHAKDKPATFVTCKFFGKPAEWVSSSIKGDRITVSGKFLSYDYTDKKTGQQARGYEILVDEFSREYKASEFKANNPKAVEQEVINFEDDLPF